MGPKYSGPAAWLPSPSPSPAAVFLVNVQALSSAFQLLASEGQGEAPGCPRVCEGRPTVSPDLMAALQRGDYPSTHPGLVRCQMVPGLAFMERKSGRVRICTQDCPARASCLPKWLLSRGGCDLSSWASARCPASEHSLWPHSTGAAKASDKRL